MGQREVYEWLHKAGHKDNRYYTIKEIQAGLEAWGLCRGAINGVAKDCLCLSCSHYLDSKIEGNMIYFKRLFKLKEKYLMIKL